MTRTVRSAALEILDRQFIRVHRAKGLSRSSILFKHVLKNAVPAILASINNTAIQIICGTLIVENFYSIRGLGYSIVDSISTRNLHLLLGCVLCLSILILGFSLLTDLISAIASPRMRSAIVSGKGGRT